MRRRALGVLCLGALAASAACAKGVEGGDNTGPDGAVISPVDGGGQVTGDDGSVTGDDAGTSGDDAATGNTTPVGPGDLVLSEIMYDPSGAEPQEEWVEVYNTTADNKDLSGVSLVDNGGRTHTISSGPVVPSHGYVILVHDHTGAAAASLPGASSAYEYGTGGDEPLLANSSQATISLKKGGTTLVTVPFGGFGLGGSGVSIQLKTLTSAASSSKSSWCESSTNWPGGDKGTPAAANDCP